MKKTIITLMACVALGATCGAAENTEKGFGLEVNGVYNFALRDIVDIEGSGGFKVDTYGLDLTAVYRINKHNSVNLRFGWATGDNNAGFLSYDENVGNCDDHWKAEITNITLMPGYRYTTAVSNSMDFFCGVNAGLVRTEVEGIETGNTLQGILFSVSEKENEWNFAWSMEVGITQKMSVNGKLTLAIQLQGLRAHPYFKYFGGEPNGQLHLGVRAGYSRQF